MTEPDLSWTRRAMRWGQINIREVEPPDFGVVWWEDYWRSIHLDGIALNAGESYEDVYWLHPDWFAVERSGQPMRERSLPDRGDPPGACRR